MSELMIPPAVKDDPEAFEILRLWAANGEQHITIHSGLNGNAYDFGYLLAQLAHHGANLYAERFNITFQESLKQIIVGFTDEIEESPEDNISGEIMK
ncbi:MAG TPA: DUF5076 domain-containing protein [Chitinophagaceae bacterium]